MVVVQIDESLQPIVRTSNRLEGLGKQGIRVGNTKEFGVGSSRKNEDGSRPSSEFVSGFGSYMTLSLFLSCLFLLHHMSHSGPAVRVLGLWVLLLLGADDLAREGAPPASVSSWASSVSWLLT